jgi:hypothetical protein
MITYPPGPTPWQVVDMWCASDFRAMAPTDTELALYATAYIDNLEDKITGQDAAVIRELCRRVLRRKEETPIEVKWTETDKGRVEP